MFNVSSSQNRYASLLLAGREQLDEGEASPCGRENESGARATAVANWNAGGATTAVQQLELAVQEGSHRAAFMLATMILSGLSGTATCERTSKGRNALGHYDTIWTFSGNHNEHFDFFRT